MQLAAGCRDPMEACCRAGARDGIRRDHLRFSLPRNTILSSAPLTATTADLDRGATEWARGNYVRIAVVLTTVILVIASLVRISRDTAPAQTK